MPKLGRGRVMLHIYSFSFQYWSVLREQIANFQKTMFCSLGILSLVLKSNAWFNRFRVCVKFSVQSAFRCKQSLQKIKRTTQNIIFDFKVLASLKQEGNAL